MVMLLALMAEIRGVSTYEMSDDTGFWRQFLSREGEPEWPVSIDSQHPPTELQTMLRIIENPLPDVRLGKDFAAHYNAIRDGDFHNKEPVFKYADRYVVSCINPKEGLRIRGKLVFTPVMTPRPKFNDPENPVNYARWITSV